MRYLEKNSCWLSVLLIPSAQSRKDLFSFFLTFLCELWLPGINPVQEFMVLHQLPTPWLPWNTVTSPTHRHLQALHPFDSEESDTWELMVEDSEVSFCHHLHRILAPQAKTNIFLTKFHSIFSFSLSYITKKIIKEIKMKLSLHPNR